MSPPTQPPVFNILRSKNLNLKHNLRPLLELESGSNDPMAYMLTILLIQIIQSGEFSFGQVLLSFFIQFSVGGIAGYLLGRCAVYTLNHFRILNQSLYQIVLLTFVFFTFSFTEKLQGTVIWRYILPDWSSGIAGSYTKRILPIFSTVQPGFSKLSCFLP